MTDRQSLSSCPFDWPDNIDPPLAGRPWRDVPLILLAQFYVGTIHGEIRRQIEAELTLRKGR
jgi:hypothetical protein